MEDLPRLLELYHQLAAGGPAPEAAVRAPSERHRAAVQELLSSPSSHLLVVEDGDRVIGTCVLYTLPNLTHGAARWGVVENVVVDAAERSHGYGETLMAAAVRLAEEAGCYRVSLASNSLRADAHRFYERIGFRHSHKGFTLYFFE
jgi:GNAT superfamily N-acetyltransferase